MKKNNFFKILFQERFQIRSLKTVLYGDLVGPVWQSALFHSHVSTLKFKLNDSQFLGSIKKCWIKLKNGNTVFTRISGIPITAHLCNGQCTQPRGSISSLPACGPRGFSSNSAWGKLVWTNFLNRKMHRSKVCEKYFFHVV